MLEFHALRALLGTMQIGIVWILLKHDIGYLWRFGVLMFACAASNIAPAFPHSEAWQKYVQFPAYVLIFWMTAEATLEIFAILRRRTFIEEHSALVAFSCVAGLLPVWVFWWWPGEDWYQTAMLARQYLLVWLTGGYVAAWFWLRKARPVHMEQRICDHGEFWAFWLLAATAHASTTKWGILWRFSQWRDAGALWRVVGDVLLMAQVVICFGFVLNLWKWRHVDENDPAQDEISGLHAPALFRRLHPPTI